MRTAFTLLLILTAYSLCYCSKLEPGAVCTEDSECPRLYFCLGSTKKVCTHDPLLHVSSSMEHGGVFISIIISAITFSGGIGGGAFLVPYLTLLNNYTPNSAIKVTSAIVVAGGLGALVHVVTKKNPVTAGPLISYNILMLCIPCLLGGSSIGSLLNRILAPIIVDILISCFFIYYSVKIGQRFWENFKNERKGRRKNRAAATIQQAAAAETGKKAGGTQRKTSLPPVDKKNPQKLNSELHEEAQSQHQQELQTAATGSKETDANSQCAQDKCAAEDKETKQICHHQHHVMGPEVESVPNYIPEPQGDEQQVEDELYELQFNNMLSLMLVSNPKKVVGAARESFRRDKLERQKSFRAALKKSQDLEANMKSIAGTSKVQAQDKLKSLFRREYRCFPIEKVWVPLLSLLVEVMMNLIIGNANFNSISHVSYCSKTYWGLYVLEILIQISIFLIALVLLFKWQKQKDQSGWEERPEDMRLTHQRAVTIFCYAFLAGCLGGVMGVGGGVVLSPLLLSYGVPPQPLAATSAVFIVCCQLSSLATFIAANSYQAVDIILLLLIAVSISYPFSRVVKWFVTKTQRQSIILAIIMAIVSLSLIAILTSMGINLRLNKAFTVAFTSYCS